MNTHETALACLPTQNEWAVIQSLSANLLPSGMLPAHIKTPEAAAAIILKGRELGIPPMQALSGIASINGKPVCGSELMLAIIYRDHGDSAIWIDDTTDTFCRISYARRGWPERKTYSFSMEDAKRAGVAGGQTWQKYPAAMLRARCISAVARMAFPDSIGGMYSPDELGGDVVVESDGESVVYVPSPVVNVMTGEVTEAAPMPRTEPREELVDRGSIMRKLHSHGLNHDELTACAVTFAAKNKNIHRTIASITELTDAELVKFRDAFLKHDADFWRDALMEAASKDVTPESNGALIDVPEDPKPRVKD
jgi:hypothetical protein